MQHFGRDLACPFEVAFRGLCESDRLASLGLQTVFLDRLGKLHRVFVVVEFGALSGHGDEQPVADVRVIDRIGKPGSEIDLAPRKKPRHHRRDRLRAVIALRHPLRNKSRRSQHIRLSRGPCHKSFRHKVI